MTQVSKHKLRFEVENRIYELLNDSFSEIRDKDEFNNFLDDFLSPIEKTVLAKRLAIAVLISKGNDYKNICAILKVTPNTVSKMSFRIKYGNGSVKKMADKIVASDDNKALLEELASIFDIPIKGLPKSEYIKKVQKRNKNIDRFKNKL